MTYTYNNRNISLNWSHELFQWDVFSIKSHCLCVNPMMTMTKLLTFFPMTHQENWGNRWRRMYCQSSEFWFFHCFKWKKNLVPCRLFGWTFIATKMGISSFALDSSMLIFLPRDFHLPLILHFGMFTFRSVTNLVAAVLRWFLGFLNAQADLS